MAKSKKEEVETISATESLDSEEKLKESVGEDLARLLTAAFSEGKDPFQGFSTLAKNLKAKQSELDVMASDCLPAAILSSYMSDVLLPNSNGDLVSIVASQSETQVVFNNIYKRLCIPEEKVVYSLLKNGIALAGFEAVSSVPLASQVVAATENASTEATLLRKPGTILPNLTIINNTFTVFPMLQYERCVGFIEVTKDISFFDTFDWEKDNLDYKDVVIHPTCDYVYETYGVRHDSKPLQLSVKQKDGKILVYDIATGCSMLENSYTAWKTLSLLQDSIVLASLIKNAQIMLVETEAGTATKQHIEAAKIKLRSLFEGQIAMGQNGMKSYLSPQSKPAYIYSFTSGGVGKITASLIGGEYNPGQLFYLTPFVNQFFAGMVFPKQLAGFTEGSAGLDGGGAVEQYTLRYAANVRKFKRLYGSFIKKCINNVLMSKGLTNLVDAFSVKVYGAYAEADSQEVQLKQAQFQLFESILNFSGIDDPVAQRSLRTVLIKQLITDPEVIKVLDEALLSSKENANNDTQDSSEVPQLGDDTQLPDDVGALLGDESIVAQGSEEPLPSEELPEMTETAELDE